MPRPLASSKTARRHHRAKAVKDWLELKNMAIMDWPSNSPDLNPIENLWLWMKKQLVNRPTPSSLAILKQEITKLWCKRTSVEYCRALVKSMPKRMQQVIDCQGEMTKY